MSHQRRKNFFVREKLNQKNGKETQLRNLDVLVLNIQSTLVISNSKGLSEILRDIRSSTYQVCRIEEKII